MKEAEINHLRRLVAWIDTEVGPAPEEHARIVGQLYDKVGDMVTPEGMERTVADQQRYRAVPKYVRAAVKALRKYVDGRGGTMEGEVISPMSLEGPDSSKVKTVRARVMRRR